jgi:hypothetical protein
MFLLAVVLEKERDAADALEYSARPLWRTKCAFMLAM